MLRIEDRIDRIERMCAVKDMPVPEILISFWEGGKLSKIAGYLRMSPDGNRTWMDPDKNEVDVSYFDRSSFASMSLPNRETRA